MSPTTLTSLNPFIIKKVINYMAGEDKHKETC